METITSGNRCFIWGNADSGLGDSTDSIVSTGYHSCNGDLHWNLGVNEQEIQQICKEPKYTS